MSLFLGLLRKLKKKQSIVAFLHKLTVFSSVLNSVSIFVRYPEKPFETLES